MGAVRLCGLPVARMWAARGWRDPFGMGADKGNLGANTLVCICFLWVLSSMGCSCLGCGRIVWVRGVCVVCLGGLRIGIIYFLFFINNTRLQTYIDT